MNYSPKKATRIFSGVCNEFLKYYDKSKHVNDNDKHSYLYEMCLIDVLNLKEHLDKEEDHLDEIIAYVLELTSSLNGLRLA